MARPLLIADTENATIEELKHVSRVGSNETATGYALKTPQPWPDKQDEQLRKAFLQQLKELMQRPVFRH